MKPGTVLTRKTWEKLYGALWKLKDYENTGKSPEEIECMDNDMQVTAKGMLKRVAELSAEVDRMKAEGFWIPVTERFPEPGDYVLLSFPDFSVPAIGRYDEDEEGGAFFIGDETESLVSQYMFVNAWMPLPKPYRAEVEEKRLEDVMRCPYCNYIPECNEQTCAGCEIYEDFLDDINDLY